MKKITNENVVHPLLFEKAMHRAKEILLFFVTVIIFVFLQNQVNAAEQELDLQLTDKSLRTFDYQPKIAESEQITFKFNGINRSYFIYTPKQIESTTPVLVALHGSARTGASMIDTWRPLADKYGFIIIAPNGMNMNWSLTTDEANYVAALLNQELGKLHIKNKDIYLFGHSSGARQAIALAVMLPNLFKKVAVHAGTLPSEVNSNNPKPNNTRVALFLGDDDILFPLASGRKTIQWLSSLGIDSTLFVLKNHGHWYYTDANKINKSLWAWLSK